MSADSFARGYSIFVTNLAEPAVRSLAMGCLAAMALWAFRVKRVTTHLQVWTAVLCAALAMPVLGAFLPRVRVAVPETPLMKSLQTSFERGPARAVRHNAAASDAIVNSVAATMPASVMSEPLIDQAASHKVKFAVGGALDEARSKKLSKTFDEALSKGVVKPLYKTLRKESVDNASGGVFDLPASAVVAPIPVPSIQNSSAATSGASAARRGFAIPWTVVVLGVYLVGVVILFARLCVGVLFSGRLERSATKIEDREALRLLRFRSCITGLAKVPGLKESAMLAVPATVGVHRAVILLPADWRVWAEEQLDAILAHEISHVARRDGLTQMLSLLHRVIFWFSPLSWWLDKQLTDLAEQASDEAALAGGADRARYAETLVGFFKQLGAAPGRVWWQGVSMAKATKASSAERRVGRILAWKESMSMKKSFALAVIALVAPVVFLAASVHPFIASAQDKPAVPPQNVIMPGGPTAPALPNAPKGGVKGGVMGGISAPALPPASQGAVVAPTMGTPPATTPSLPNAPSGGFVASSKIGPGPIAPPALIGSRIVRPSQIPAIAPTAPPTSTGTSIASTLPLASETSPAPPTPVASIAPTAPEQDQSSVTITSGSYTSGSGPRYVMMLDSSDCAETSCNVSMSGSDEDLEHARKLRKNIKGPFIWFERDEKSYVITDAPFIAKVKALFAPEDALARQEDELGRKEDELGKQEDALGEQQDNVKVNVPDISPDIERIRTEIEELRKENGATQSELGRLQSELGALQNQIGRYQSRAGVQQSGIGRQQGDLGRQQAELGRKQAELGRQQAEISRNATRQLRGMFDDAIAKGIAKPE